MTGTPPVPTDPADIKAWAASLNRDQLEALTRQLLGGEPAAAPAQFQEPGNTAIVLPPPPAEPVVLTLTIELLECRPTIWRRLSLPGAVTLDAVHTLFQAAMGWADSHLHRFHPGVLEGYDQPYFVTAFDEEEGDEGTREGDTRLDQVLRAPGDRLTYLYDFGDGWQHLVTLESLAPLTPDNREPVCLAGANACPPEDVGGVWGYEDVAAWLRAGAPVNAVPGVFENAGQAHRWLPPGFDPDTFDAAEATAQMRHWASGEHAPWHSLPEPLADLIQALRGHGLGRAHIWLAELGPRVAEALDEDEVRRAAEPWLALLRAVGPGTKLTPAGRLPPAVVAAIAEDIRLGEWWPGRTDREDLVRPVGLIRAAAQELGLLRKAKGMLTPTARARAVAGDDRALVAAVLGRLPRGKGFEADAGWLALLGIAAGRRDADLHNGVAQMLTDRGWRSSDGSNVGAWDAHRGLGPTLDLLRTMAGGLHDTDTALLTRLAHAALFGSA